MSVVEIAKRIERASGGKEDAAVIERRAIDAWIHDSLMPKPKVVEPLRYTASIDAAVALTEQLLPDCPWMIARLGYDDGVYQGGKAGAYLLWPLTMSFHNVRAFAATPALALCLAALRAASGDRP